MTGLPTGDAVPVHVLRFFDALTCDRASVAHIVTATGRWLGRVVAVRHAGSVHAADGAGTTGNIWPDSIAATSSTPCGVLVGLGGPVGPEDWALLQRLSLCVTLALDEATQYGSLMSEQRTVHVLATGSESRAARRGAAAHLGLTAEQPSRILLAHGPDSGVAALIDALRRGGVRVMSAPGDRLTVLLTVGPRVTTLLQQGVPTGVQVGVSRELPVIDAPAAAAEALAALRFSQPSPRDQGPYLIEEGVAFEYWRLRGYEALAEAMTPELINRMDDVRALDRVLAESGADMLRTLDVVVASTSIRQAARALDTHHNTVAHRVAAAEAVFGFFLTDCYGRGRLYLAIVLRRLRESHRLTL
ncbi:helix-turn-helix domain-containing protein [Nocardia sp. NPDC055321]